MRPDGSQFYPNDALSSASLPARGHDVQTLYQSDMHALTTDASHGELPSTAGELASLEKWVAGSQAVTAATGSLLEFMQRKAQREAIILNSLGNGSHLPPEQHQQSYLQLDSLASSLNIEISNLLQSFYEERQEAGDHLSKLSRIISDQQTVISDQQRFISEQQRLLALTNEPEEAVSSGSRQPHLSLSKINVYYVTDEAKAEVKTPIAPAVLEDVSLGRPLGTLCVGADLRPLKSLWVADEAQAEPARPESSQSVHSVLPYDGAGSRDTKPEADTKSVSSVSSDDGARSPDAKGNETSAEPSTAFAEPKEHTTDEKPSSGSPLADLGRDSSASLGAGYQAEPHPMEPPKSMNSVSLLDIEKTSDTEQKVSSTSSPSKLKLVPEAPRSRVSLKQLVRKKPVTQSK